MLDVIPEEDVAEVMDPMDVMDVPEPFDSMDELEALRRIMNAGRGGVNAKGSSMS